MIDDRLIKKNMWKWANDLFPVCRSITGEGVRFTLNYIKKINANLKIYKVKSGSRYFDWQVPYEWKIKDAYIKKNKKKS